MLRFVWSMRLFFLFSVCFLVGGCGLQQDQEALYKFEAGKRVLVLVDVRSAASVPPEFAIQLGQSISEKLMQWGAMGEGGVVVPQSKVLELKASPSKFSQMGIADIAQAAGADVVLHVDLIAFNVTSLSDDSITQGGAQVLVKVVDREGNRAWPIGVAMGVWIDARVAPTFSEQRDRTGVQKELSDLLAVRTARMFIKYRLDDKAIAR
ncbi:MAG: hypothetical protein FWD53_01945 [Phycisphaerales bacterium]|nr:hypothetical protein [Phycisphaerales bacterium]